MFISILIYNTYPSIAFYTSFHYPKCAACPTLGGILWSVFPVSQASFICVCWYIHIYISIDIYKHSVWKCTYMYNTIMHVNIIIWAVLYAVIYVHIYTCACMHADVLYIYVCMNLVIHAYVLYRQTGHRILWGPHWILN